MKQMWSKGELVKLIQEHGGQITPQKLISLLDEGDNIAIEIVATAEGSKVRISASGGGGSITPQQLAEILKGSESVVVDLSEDEEYLEVHLDADILAKLERALLLPLSVSEFKLIGVDNEANKKATKKATKNAPTQQLIGLGDMFSVDNDKLNLHLYEHNLEISKTDYAICIIQLTIINNSPDMIDFTTLKNYLTLNRYHIASGVHQETSSSEKFSISGISKNFQNKIQYIYDISGSGALIFIIDDETSAIIRDTTRQII